MWKSQAKRTSPLVLAVFAVFFLTGVVDAKQVPSSKGEFPDKPDPERIVSYVVTATFDETFDAAIETIRRMGLFVEEQDRHKGKINGNGKYQIMCGSGPCLIKILFAIYIQVDSDRPTAEVSVDRIRRGFMGWGGGGNRMRDEFFIELQKVLVTYQ